MKEYMNRNFLGNSPESWATAFGIFLGALFAIYIFKKIIIRHLKRLSQKTATTLDDFIVEATERSVVPALYVVAFYFSFNTLNLLPWIRKIIYLSFLFAVTFFVLRIIIAVVRQFVFSFISKQEDSETKKKQAKGLMIIVNFVIWVLGLVFLIDNLGYDVTTLITGLGIGGIAIALAAQTILGDLFSYFVIFFDRPFEIGDNIMVDDKRGTVEYVGVKTTRIRTLSGEQLICSNTYLTNSRVHNFKRMVERRVVLNIGVLYQTPQEVLRRIPEMVRSIIDPKENIRFDRGHFVGFGDFSLNFEFVYFIESPDYPVYMDMQQMVNLDIVDAFEKEGIEFAYPTQTLFVQKQGSENQAGKV
jgi:small-conductance mechanosensitive channel